MGCDDGLGDWEHFASPYKFASCEADRVRYMAL